MQEIVVDEASHAFFSWQLAAWFDSRLDDAAHARVNDAVLKAKTELAIEIGATSDAETMRHLGLPHANQARAIHAALDESLWKRAS